MTALFRQLDRLAALRLAEPLSAPDATAQLQAVSEALYGASVPDHWLPQVLEETPAGAPPGDRRASRAATLPVYATPRPEAEIAQNLARSGDRAALFPELTLPALTDNPQSLTDQMARVQAPTPTGWWAHYRPANEGVRRHTLAQIHRWRLDEVAGTFKRQVAILGSAALAMASVLAHTFHHPLVTVACLLGFSAGLGLGFSQRTRYLPKGEGRRLALKLVEDWQPVVLPEADLKRAQAFPELAQAVHRWATSDTGLLRQDLYELRWRHKHLRIAQQHADHLAALATSTQAAETPSTSTSPINPGSAA